MSVIISKLFMMFVAIAAAFIAVKKGLWDRHGNKVLSNAVTFVLNPATMLASAISGERPLTNLQVFQTTGIAVACYAFLILSGFLIPKILRVPKDSGRLYRFMYIFSNVSFFGFPVVQALFGASAAFLVVIYVLPFQLLIFTYGITLIAGDRKNQKFSPKMLLHPMILASSSAYVLYLTKIQFPAFITDAVSFLGGATSTIAMLVVGGTLAFAPLKKMFLNWRLYALSVIKMLILPLGLYFVLKRLLPLSESNLLIIGVSTVIMAMPTAATTTILANQYGGDTDTAASGVCLSTILALFCVPLLMWFMERI